MEQKRGRGRPAGSVNKPKIEQELHRAEEKLAGKVGALMDVLLDSAVVRKNTSDARYLLDRVLGKPAEKVEQKVEQKIEIEYVNDWRG